MTDGRQLLYAFLDDRGMVHVTGPDARAFQKSDLQYSVPWKNKPDPRMKDVVNFERWDSFGRQLVDRKLNVTRRSKSVRQAQRQAAVASQHGVGVRWEVPTSRVHAAEGLRRQAGPLAEALIDIVGVSWP